MCTKEGASDMRAASGNDFLPPDDPPQPTPEHDETTENTSTAIPLAFKAKKIKSYLLV